VCVGRAGIAFSSIDSAPMTNNTSGPSIRPAPASCQPSAPCGVAVSHQTVDSSQRNVNEVWELAAPVYPSSDTPATAQHATITETAADFFDIVFVTVALVTYSAQQLSASAVPHTGATRKPAASRNLLAQSPAAAHRGGLTSGTIRFACPTTATKAPSDPVSLSSLTASTPDADQASESRQSTLDSRSPTGPPRLPNISVRGWTSRYA